VNKLIKPHYAQIWQTVQLIPEGKVACYGQIADLAGLPGRARLVGKALASVPESSWQGRPVPWYRVINAQGRISFPPDSEHFAQQKQLLQDEQVLVLGSKVKLKAFQWQPNLADVLFGLTF